MGRIWKNVLKDLEPNLAQIKHYRSHIDPEDMIKNMQKTMNLVSDTYTPTCGRLITSSIEEHMYSNKGGNCVPFEKLNEIMYRLEYETSAAESGKMRGDNFIKFKDGLCKIGNKLENTYYTFRQLAYRWDHAMKKTDLSRMRIKPVLTTDKTYVTGVTDGLGCRSLRQYVAAINGMAQINSFRDTGIIEGGEYWHESIRETRSYIESYADILNDFYDTSTKIFPLIEFEDVEECPVGNVEINKFNLGLEISPLCDNVNFITRTKLNKMSFEAQTLARSECFCRMGQLSSKNGRLQARCTAGVPVGSPVTSCDGTCDSGDLNTDKNGCVEAGANFTAGHFIGEETDDVIASADMYEAEEVYLMFDDTKLLAKCDSFKSLESVYHYCTSSYTETRIWKNVLKDLEPNLAQIKHYRSHIDPEDMIKNMQKTMNLVSDTYTPTCGRLITSSIEEHMYSNKGGNCVPFEKLNEIMYRLEYETSAAESGKMRGDNFIKFKDGLCKIGNKLENTYYTFRQLAYRWDHAMKKTDLSRMRIKPVTKNLVSLWQNFKRDQHEHAETPVDRLYWRDPEDQTEPMCFVDWVHEITGDSTVYDAAGTVYDDPYSLFAREIEEAIFNVDIAKQTKLETRKDHELLWAAIEEELTSIEPNRLNYQISLGLAKHFMRIVTTDSDDEAVDGKDLHAEDADTELPEKIVDITGTNT